MADEGTAFRFIDLFAGLGGFHVALQQLGGEGVFAAEWDATLNELYKVNFDIQPWADIDDLEDEAMIAREVPEHDVLTAGFPCQPFSKAGEQLGFSHTLQGKLFFKVLAILKEKRPRRFILENVPNILRHQNGETLSTFARSLKTSATRSTCTSSRLTNSACRRFGNGRISSDRSMDSTDSSGRARLGQRQTSAACWISRQHRLAQSRLRRCRRLTCGTTS